MADVIDDILFPTADKFNHYISTVDEADLKKIGQFSEESLSSLYKRAKVKQGYSKQKEKSSEPKE